MVGIFYSKVGLLSTLFRHGIVNWRWLREEEVPDDVDFSIALSGQGLV